MNRAVISPSLLSFVEVSNTLATLTHLFIQFNFSVNWRFTALFTKSLVSRLPIFDWYRFNRTEESLISTIQKNTGLTVPSCSMI